MTVFLLFFCVESLCVELSCAELLCVELYHVQYVIYAFEPKEDGVVGLKN